MVKTIFPGANTWNIFRLLGLRFRCVVNLSRAVHAFYVKPLIAGCEFARSIPLSNRGMPSAVSSIMEQSLAFTVCFIFFFSISFFRAFIRLVGQSYRLKFTLILHRMTFGDEHTEENKQVLFAKLFLEKYLSFFFFKPTVF